MYGYLYILYSPSRDKYYIGASTQPGERLIRHNAGYSNITAANRRGS
jgi:predicted GIY-YIG superfamily endonuclease